MKRILLLVFLCSVSLWADAQALLGTTGLLHAPTADMQRDKTFLFGGNYLNTHPLSTHFRSSEVGYTFNYYINITIFPWLEAGYLCTGHKAVHTDYGNNSGYWVPSTYGKFTNQDRSFHFRLRVWKEGWWKLWTPQIVLGANDAIGDSWNGGSFAYPSETTYGNGYWNRYYLAVTKHVIFQNIGELGAHLTWIYSTRFDNNLNSPAIGVNFQLKLKGKSLINKLVNGVNLMVEVVPGYTEVNEDLIFNPDSPKYQVNLGMTYSVWKDYINLVGELNRCKYLSAGVFFRVHLK